MRTIYLDVSDTVRMRLNTGIQRVVRRIVAEGAAVADEFGVAIVPVILTGESIRLLNPVGVDTFNTPVEPVLGLGVNELVKGYSGLKNFLKRFKGPYDYIRRRAVIRRNFGHLVGAAVRPGPGDCVVLLDAFWNLDSAVTVARRARGRFPIVGVIYDMIPVTNPELFHGDLPALFASRLTELVTLGVRFIAISQDAAAKALDYARPRGYAGDVGTFYLGFDLPGAKTTARPADDAWPEALWDGQGPVHVMVGTVEPRKGIDVAVDAMEVLWAAGRTDKLLIIGRVGWRTICWRGCASIRSSGAGCSWCTAPTTPCSPRPMSAPTIAWWRRAPKASACPWSRRWPTACPWSPPISACSARSRRTWRCSSARATGPISPARWSSWTASAMRGARRHARSTGSIGARPRASSFAA